MSGYAWVTLATNNSYSLGALVLAHSLKKSNTAHKLVALITSSVSESMRNQLSTVFDVVKLVDVLDSKDEAHLALMQRPELGITFTKIHCWRLVEFEKCVFLDADTLVVRNCDELFEREEFSAAPDASWPDCFNSGVFVFRPSIDTFNKILKFAVENKSFDGGDQGLLNLFFSSWATEDIKKHLPFVYNLTSIGSYAYVPAFKHYGSEARIVHFIGTGKPWLQQLDIATRTVTPSSGYEHLAPLLQQWWDLFCEKVHPNLDKNLESSNEEMSHSPVEACSNSLPIALTDEPQTLRLIPCTLHEEKVVTEHNVPFKTNDSSGESPKLVVAKSKRTERVEPNWRKNVCGTQKTPERTEEVYKESRTTSQRGEEGDKEEKKEQRAWEESPPKDPFDYESFFPDESCIKSYLEQNVVTYQPFESRERVQTPKEPEPLPRFLTMPEDDRRQSGNVDVPVEKKESQRQSTPKEEARSPIRRETPPRETLTKSKSMPFLPLEVIPQPPRSIWKSQPNVNVDPNKKYSMPKLKPILPKQNRKSVLTKIPKVTHYTEFLMSSDYKDPVNLPKDRIGFVATQLHTQKHKRNKPNVRTKFGPLPFTISPEIQRPASKKIRLEHSDDDLYDLTQCKRQSGNKPKQKDVQRKQNGNNLEEILKRLKEFSKDYQHYFGLVPKPKRRTIMCKNAAVQASGEGECRTSEAFKTVRTAVSSWSRATQTLSQREEFRLFRNYVKDQNEASQKGLLMISGRNAAEDTDPKFAEVDEKTRNGDVIMKESNGVVKSGFHDRNKTARSTKLKNTSLTHSETEEKAVARSENRLDLVVEEEQRKNPDDDVTVSKSNGVSLKLQKSLEFSEKSPRAQNSRFGNEKELIAHSENQSGLSVEENQGKNVGDDVTAVQSNGGSVQKLRGFHKGGAEVPNLHFMNSEEPAMHSNIQPGLGVEENQRKNPRDDVILAGVSLKSQKSEFSKDGVSVESPTEQSDDRNEKPAAHSKNQFRSVIEESQCDDVITVPKESEFGEGGIKSPRARIPHLESDEESVVHSETQSGLGVEENQQKNVYDDVATARVNRVLLEARKPSAFEEGDEFSTVQNERFENRSELTVEKNRLDDDVTTTHDNDVSSEVEKSSELDKNSVESPEIESSRCGNEEELVVHSENQSGSLAEEYRRGDDVTTASADLRKSSEVGAFGDPSHSVLPKNESELVAHSENRSGSAGEEDQDTDDDVTNGIHSAIPDRPQPVIHSSSAETNQRANTADDVIRTQNNAALYKSGERKDFETEFHSSATTGCSKKGTRAGNKEANRPNATERGDDAESTSVTSGPVVVLKHSGLAIQPMKSDAKARKPEEILCVPDFETPRSSRVTVKNTEEEMTAPKPRKSRSSPKNVRERFTRDSPDESVRFDGKKNSPSGNVQPERVEDQKGASGIAGAIAQLSLQAGSERTAEPGAASAAHQEYLRRQNWETGNMDYMGKDSFDNIWSKICQTLETKVQEPPSSTGEVKKPSEALPEFIETLPGKPAPGPVEDDEIIFSKSGSRQSGLTNITEEEEVRREGAKLPNILEAGDLKLETEGVKGDGKAPEVKPIGSDVGIESPVLLPDANLQPTATEIKPQDSATEIKPQPTPTEIKPQVPATEVKPQPTATEVKPQPTATEVKPQPTATEVKPQPTATEVKPQPTATEAKPQVPATEVKPQPTATEVKPQVPATEVKPQPTATEVKPQVPATEVKPQPVATEVKPQPTATEVKPQPTATEVKPQVPATEVKPQPTATEVKPQPTATEVKPQPTATEVKPQPTATEVKPQPTATEAKPQVPATEVKPQPTATEVKPQVPATEVKPQPAATGVKPQPTATEVKPQPTATEAKPQVPATEAKPQVPATEAKPQAPATEVKPQPTATEVKPQPTATEVKPQVSATEVKPQPTATEIKPQAPATEVKPQPTATEIIPKPAASEVKSEHISAVTDIKSPIPAASAEETPQPAASDSLVTPTADRKQLETPTKPTAEPSEECKVVAIPSPPILPPSTRPKSKQPQEKPQVQSEPIPLPPPDSPSSEEPVKTSRADSLKDDGKQKKGVFSKILEMVGMKDKNGSEEGKSVFYDVEGNAETGVKEDAKQTEETQPEAKEPQKVEKKEPEAVQPVSEPERSSKDLQQSIQVSEKKRKSPSPKLTMPQKPETEVTTPTPPANEETPPRKNSALLKVEETILETPPVPEPSSIQTEIEDIIGKAKTEVETLLQDRAEKETSDMINAMKLIMGEEQEEVEELKVTSEEERKRHKGEVVSSKLSDQILKAIPPPRRKAISEATASTSAIPKGTPEQKSPQTAEGKTKSSKPSSIPVPPPRNKGKPQPPTSKGKGKK